MIRPLTDRWRRWRRQQRELPHTSVRGNGRGAYTRRGLGLQHLLPALLVVVVVLRVATTLWTLVGMAISSSFSSSTSSALLASTRVDAALAERLWHVASHARRLPEPELPLNSSKKKRKKKKPTRPPPPPRMQTRGIVLPLFDAIAPLGVSLVLELRELGVELPIEIPHCGDLSAPQIAALQDRDALVRVYDVCALAATPTTTDTTDTSHRELPPLFCVDEAQCHERFRSFNIKILALVLSQFHQVLLLDADTLFFSSPEALFDTPLFQRAGTLFFHDRMTFDRHYLAEREPISHPATATAAATTTATATATSKLHLFLSEFDVSPFAALATIPRNESTPLARLVRHPLPFTASTQLLQSHAWALRAGHHMDSSVVLWDKRRQPRATALLASLISHTTQTGVEIGTARAVPSYGDKEYYFLACELAETEYAFSPFGVGTIGVDIERSASEPDGAVLCGDALHYTPPLTTKTAALSGTPEEEMDPPALYINSDSMLTWKLAEEQGQESPSVPRPPSTTVQEEEEDGSRLTRTTARRAEWFPGSPTVRGFSQTCALQATLQPLTSYERSRVERRQLLHARAVAWATERTHHPTLWGSLVAWWTWWWTSSSSA